MAPEQRAPRSEGPGNENTSNTGRNQQRARYEEDDFMDTDSDRDRLRSEVAYIDLPDISDIPGQEHIHTAPLGELADVTISSDDEEGIIGDDSDDDGYFEANNGETNY